MNEINAKIINAFKEDRYQLLFKLLEKSELACKLINSFLKEFTKDFNILERIKNLEDFEFKGKNKNFCYSLPMVYERQFLYYNNGAKYDDVNRLNLFFSYFGNNYYIETEIFNYGSELKLLETSLRKNNGISKDENADIRISLINEKVDDIKDNLYLKITTNSLEDDLLNYSENVYIGKIDDIQQLFYNLTHSIEEYEQIQIDQIEKNEDINQEYSV